MNIFVETAIYVAMCYCFGVGVSTLSGVLL